MPESRPFAHLVLVAVGFALAACAGSGGFQQAALREKLGVSPVVNDGEVAKALALRPQLPKPFRLGVFFRDARSEGSEARWRFRPEDKSAMLDVLGELERRGEIGQVFVIDTSLAADDQLPAIRLAAARHGADAVLVVSGIDAAEVTTNLWGLSYVALVPMLLAPGSSLETIFMSNAELWDVRNEYLYMAAHAESEARQQRPLAWVDEDEAASEAQSRALQLLNDELRKRLGKLVTGS